MKTTLLTTAELADRLGVHFTTIEYLRKVKGLPGVFTRRGETGRYRHLYDLAEIRRWAQRPDVVLSRRMQDQLLDKPKVITSKRTREVWLEAEEVARLLDLRKYSVREWAGDPNPPETRFDGSNRQRKIYYKLQLTLSWETKNEKIIGISE